MALDSDAGDEFMQEGPPLNELQEDFDDIKSRASKCYAFAQHKAEKNLMSAHPIRLGIALNFSVFRYDHENS